MNRIAAVVAGLSLAFVGTSATYAATHTVCPSGCDYTTIQDAINASSNGDVILIDAGTYYETNINPEGREITVRGEISELGEPQVTINGAGGSCLSFTSEETQSTVFENLLLIGGTGTDDPGESGMQAGGIYIREAGPHLINVWADGNQYGQVFCNSGDPFFENCRFINNPDQGWSNKAAIWQHQTWQLDAGFMHFNNCEFSNNHGEFAGAFYARHHGGSSLRLVGCTFTGNTGQSAGGLGVAGGPIGAELDPSTEILSCTFTNNTGEASYNGSGAIYAGSDILLLNCRIQDNTGIIAGGIGCELPFYDDPWGGSSPGSIALISGSVVCGNVPNQCNRELYPVAFGSSCIQEECDTCAGDDVGICCIWGGTCVEYSTVSFCADIGGTFSGSEVSCINDGCPEIIYRPCCTSSGCIELESDDCDALGGTWLGEDGSCDDCPITCDGDTNSDGVIDIEDLLNMLGSWGASC